MRQGRSDGRRWNLSRRFSILLLSLLGGCAASEGSGLIPVCQVFTGYYVVTEKGPGIFIDEPNAMILRETLLGLSEGKCRLE